jgi:hypothetical protein
MACFHQLPDEILLKIFSYLSIDDLSQSIRNVCTRWRTVSEDDEIWFNLRYCPDAHAKLEDINCTLENMPALRQFLYLGTFSFIQKLCECCRRIRVLNIPHTTLNATDFMLAMRCLTELRDLGILMSSTEEGLQITRIIGQSETLTCLRLYSSDGGITTPGLLKPIAEGCPNLDILECEAFNSPIDEICYLLQNKKRQLVAYDHYGPFTGNLFAAINECTNLKRLSLTGVEIYGVFNNDPPVMNLQNLEALMISDCRFPTVKIIPLTLFLNTLPQLTYIGIPYTLGNIDVITNKIILQCPLLMYLNLEGNYELHCRALRNIGSCKLLKYLDVSHCIELGKKAMKYVAEGCPELQHLDVSGISMLESMFRQILRCRNLKNLLMKNCDLAPINLGSISTHIDCLLYFYIGPDFQLPHDVRNQLKKQMPQLVIKEFSVTCDKCEYFRMKTDFLPRHF